MNRKMLRLAGRTAVLVALVATLWVAGASAAVQPDSCPTDKPLVVDAYLTGENAADYGPAGGGHVWALDAGTLSIRIWRLGGDAYCLQQHEVGTFTTFAGLSPEGTGTVRGGATGPYEGTIYTRIYGTFAPTVATTGFLGNFDFQCQQDGTCVGQRPSIRRFYFPSGYRHVDPGTFAYTYDGGACGTWFQSSNGDTGDIVC